MAENNNQKIQESNSYGGLFLLGSVLAVKTIFKRKKFVEFIDTIKFNLRIKKFESSKAILNLMPLTALNIPYKIKRIDLLFEKVKLAATNSSCDLNFRIVSNSNIDIVFNVISPDVTQNMLENSEIAITYSFLGFSFQRLYKPLKVLTNNNSTTVVDGPTNCGCYKR